MDMLHVAFDMLRVTNKDPRNTSPAEMLLYRFYF